MLACNEISDIMNFIYDASDDLLYNPYCDIDKACDTINIGINKLISHKAFEAKKEILDEFSAMLVDCDDLSAGATALAYLHFDFVSR